MCNNFSFIWLWFKRREVSSQHFSDFCSKQNSPATKGNVPNIQQMIYKIRNLQSKWLKYDGKSNKFQYKYCKCSIWFVVHIWIWYLLIYFICSDNLLAKCHYLKICLRSFTYNHHMSQDYASDVALEPIIWIVDNFSGFLGPVNTFSIANNDWFMLMLNPCVISVFCCCCCCINFSCSCDCSFGWAIVLVGKESSNADISGDIRLLATYQCNIPLCYGCIHTVRLSAWCKWWFNI